MNDEKELPLKNQNLFNALMSSTAYSDKLNEQIKMARGHMNLYRLFSCEGSDSYDPECAEKNLDKVMEILSETYQHDTSALDALAKELAEEKQLRRDIEKFYAGAAVDAKRYRWLRHGDNDSVVLNYAGDEAFLLRNELLDAAIDEAMK
jgi:hypothetical protein